eukprot:COSAG01_NODE_447_length_16933_cov_9.983426_3_plen_69_part_00
MVSVFTGSQIVAGFLSGVVVLDEFAGVTNQTFYTHCVAVSMVMAGITTLVLGEQGAVAASTTSLTKDA